MKGLIIACTASLVLCGCRNDARPADDQATGSIDSAAWEQARTLPAGVAEALDSGNAAFRNGFVEASSSPSPTPSRNSSRVFIGAG